MMEFEGSLDGGGGNVGKRGNGGASVILFCDVCLETFFCEIDVFGTTLAAEGMCGLDDGTAFGAYSQVIDRIHRA